MVAPGTGLSSRQRWAAGHPGSQPGLCGWLCLCLVLTLPSLPLWQVRPSSHLVCILRGPEALQTPPPHPPGSDRQVQGRLASPPSGSFLWGPLGAAPGWGPPDRAAHWHLHRQAVVILFPVSQQGAVLSARPDPLVPKPPAKPPPSGSTSLCTRKKQLEPHPPDPVVFSFTLCFKHRVRDSDRVTILPRLYRQLPECERVTGRKAKGLQREEIACKCQTFLSLLSGRRKQTSNIFFFSIQI